MAVTPVEIWLLIGIALILIEFSTIPGIGFLFVGFGCLSTAILIYYYPLIIQYQLVALGLFSLLWFLLLWWPLKRYVYGKNSKGKDHFDLVGSEVKVLGEPINPDSTGQVEWSGTIMNAKLDEHEKQEASPGQRLYVTEVRGNILICSRRNPRG